MDLYENERIDYVNDNISLIQKTGGLTFGTDALLLAGYVFSSYNTGLELGAGSGIISMLLLTRGKCKNIVALEVQEEYAQLTQRNAELNGLSERLTSLTVDARTYKAENEFPLIFTNPPYMKTDSGKKNVNDAKNIARHEVCGDIYDFLSAVKRNLKFGGDFYCVYRPDRMIDLLDAMRQNGIEPKRITAVCANTESAPSMILVMGKRGGGSFLKMTKPLIIYRDEKNQDYTDDMNYIMESGSFPKEFFR